MYFLHQFFEFHNDHFTIKWSLDDDCQGENVFFFLIEHDTISGTVREIPVYGTETELPSKEYNYQVRGYYNSMNCEDVVSNEIIDVSIASKFSTFNEFIL